MKNDYQNDLKELTHSSFNNYFAISISSFDGADSFGHCVLGGGASFVQIPTIRDAMKLVNRLFFYVLVKEKTVKYQNN